MDERTEGRGGREGVRPGFAYCSFLLLAGLVAVLPEFATPVVFSVIVLRVSLAS